MAEQGNIVHVTVKTERLDIPSPTEGRFVEVVFVITDQQNRGTNGSATFRLSADQWEMPSGDDADLVYITEAQRFFKECAEAEVINRPDLRSGN